MSTQLSIAYVFETPLIVDEVPGSSDLNVQFQEIIRERQLKDPRGGRRSNYLGWQSDTDMIEWGGEAAMRLAEHAVSLANRFTHDTGSRGTPRYIWWPEMWANVSGRTAFNQFHTHPGAFWAAVYYVEDGYGGSDASDIGGDIVLEDPRMPMLRMEAPDLRFQPNPNARISECTHSVRPRSGTMLMFPGWLRHGVKPYLGDSTRISIAINLTALLPPSG